MQTLHIYPGIHELTRALYADFHHHINRLHREKKLIHIALSGGNTPGAFFDMLARNTGSAADFWKPVHLYWVDERCVPPGHPESNYGMTFERLLQKIPVNAGQVHPIRGGDDPEFECTRYADEIRKNIPVENGFPVFDWIFLGMGDDGHTASIFPGNTNLFDTELICARTVHPVSGQQRITLTGKVINQAKRISFLVTGESKSPVISKVLHQEHGSELFPASLIKPVHGRLDWYLDEPAGSLLKTPGHDKQ